MQDSTNLSNGGGSTTPSPEPRTPNPKPGTPNPESKLASRNYKKRNPASHAPVANENTPIANTRKRLLA